MEINKIKVILLIVSLSGTILDVFLRNGEEEIALPVDAWNKNIRYYGNTSLSDKTLGLDREDFTYEQSFI